MERLVLSDDYDAPGSWRLVRWAIDVGASEFSIVFMITPGHPAPVVRDWEHALSPFVLGENHRETMSRGPGEEFVRPMPIWRLNDASIAVLRRCLPEGLFTPPSYAADGWAEDPVFYREGEMVLGILSHERSGLLRTTQDELAEVTRAGFPSHAMPGRS